MLYYTYIETNSRNTVLYVGVSNNLDRRMFEHANKLSKGFTSRYNINKLVWYETFIQPMDAISAEKRIKGWKRDKKVKLILSANSDFHDLLNDPRDPSPSSG